MPIGSSMTPFKGHFDGNGYTIYGLSIQNDVYGYAGLFGKVEGSKISGLSVKNANISNQSGTTGIICEELAGGGEISNCSVLGGSVSSFFMAGGICGSNSSSTIKYCNVRGITIKGAYAGGICGQGSGTLESCTVYDTHVTAGSRGGGIVSEITGDSVIMDCRIYDSDLYCTLDDTYAYAGGLIGLEDAKQLTVSDCTANIDIRLAKSKGQKIYAGGIAGYVVQDGTYNTGKSSYFTNCLFNGKFINEEDAIIDFEDGAYANISGGAYSKILIYIGAAIGCNKNYGAYSYFTSCSYNADKTGGLPVVSYNEGTEVDYSGITAVHLGN